MLTLILILLWTAAAMLAGYYLGYGAGEKEGYAAGDAAGYGRGHADGMAKGRTHGLDDGFASGHAAGQSDGYAKGYGEGVQRGIRDARAEAIIPDDRRTARVERRRRNEPPREHGRWIADRRKEERRG